MKRYQELYRVQQLPVFQNRIFHSEEEARNCTKGDMVLVQDLRTGLIFNQGFSSQLVQYDSDYQNEQAVSPVFQHHLQGVAAIIQNHFQGLSLVEVGCGKGYFLEQLQELDFAIKGFDPAYQGANPAVIKDYFTPAVRLRGDGVILRHVLEHIQDPVEFLSRLRDSNGGCGKIYIEVPCFDWICDRRTWFDIFYEHVNYFRLKDFYRIFGTVYEAGHIFGGQYPYVVADLKTIRTPSYDESDRIEFPKDFLHTVTQYSSKLKSQSPNTFAIWGGASKGVIFGLLIERAGARPHIVIDINPGKQGKYLGATGLQVHSPETAIERLIPGAEILVMNGNYLREIQDLTQNKFNYLLVENEIKIP